MSFEICCQCEGTTGRAGRGEDSLYTDNDWGPYCEDCWGDGDYWRCLTDEKVSEIERLEAALTRNAEETARMILVHERYTADARTALELGATWGLASKGYDAATAIALAEWINGGFMESPPKCLLPTSDSKTGASDA